MTSSRWKAPAIFGAVLLVLTVVAVARAAPTSSANVNASDCGEHWIDAWTASTQDTTAAVAPQVFAGGQLIHTFAKQTLRMIITPQASGDSIRVSFSNQFGTAELQLTDLHVAVAGEGSSVVAGTDHRLLFDGSTNVTIPPGATVLSDPTTFSVAAFVPLAITYYVPHQSTLDVHVAAMHTEFATPRRSGDHAGDVSGASYTETLGSSLAVNSVEVQVPSSDTSVVAIGDSLTDGIGSTENGNARWTDDLNRRLQLTSQHFVVVNAGISGNQVATDNIVGRDSRIEGAGLSTRHRFERDTLDQPGVGTVIVYSGINDLLAPQSGHPADAVIDSYLAMIDEAHRAGVRILGATLTPAGRSGAVEAERQAVNRWIRTSAAFDGVIDFDAAVRNPSDPSHITPELTTDSLHLDDAGYRLLADAVDVTLFPPTVPSTSCAP